MSFVEVRDISKRFAATQALTGVSLSLEKGEVHGLLGENGAGKSTLTKILAGVLVPDSGSASIDGHGVALGHPLKSRAAGLSMAYQELSTPPNVTVAEKLFLPRLPISSYGLVSRKRLYSKAQDVLDRFGKGDIDPRAITGSLNSADQQHVEIIAALAIEPKVLILDEPTSSLPDAEWVFERVRDLVELGSSVIYISHKLAEITQICHRGTVLRNGVVVEEFSGDRVNERELVELMIGRSLNQAFPSKRSAPVDAQEPVVSVEGLQIDDRFSGIEVSVYPGEIVGVAALEGQGQRKLFYSLAGILKADSGHIIVRSGHSDSTKAKQDFALVPEDRKTEGLLLAMTARSNLTISELSQFSLLGAIQKRKERAFASEAAAKVNLPEALLSRAIRNLSGGNQQKVLFGRTILRDPSCLLLYDPTRGVDVATKVEIYHMIRRFADAGGAVLMYSTEIPALVGLCDRVYTIYGGRVSGEFAEDSLSESALMAGALGFDHERVA